MICFRWYGSQWTNHYQSSNSGTQANGEVTSQFVGVFDTFFTLGSSTVNNPLPVELLSFTAQPIGHRVKLIWETASELNNHYFDVEVSTDGRKFEFVERVQGKGTTSERQLYQAWDFRPAMGNFYYRLRQVDYDGKQALSKVVRITISDTAMAEVNAFPNPVVSEELRLRFVSLSRTGPIHIELFDVHGRIVRVYYGIITNAEESEMVFEHSLSKGFYLLRAFIAGQMVQTRVVIK
ncbi:MAG: T9SS type A sorting domain-containing protein [Cyclobacteriaceae bacterium]|nr:T9SS type A sorting domain-containing protein [Cyclobacteriaceae bacterium]